MKDSKGRLIKVGMSVDVPEPNEGDYHNNDFTGHVVELRGDKIIVQDQDNLFFTIEPESVTINVGEEVKVSPEEVKRVIQAWIEEADCDTLLRIYNENFDEPIRYGVDDLDSYQFTVPIEEADRVGMEYDGNADYIN